MKMWWCGDQRVEPYMQRINEALDRSGLQGEKRTDVYNRAYESIYDAIKDMEKKLPISNVLRSKVDEEKGRGE